MHDDDPHAVLLSTAHARALLRTDRRGRVLRRDGLEPAQADHLAARVDLVMHAIGALGGATGLGAPNTVVLEHEGGLLLAGRTAHGRHVAVVAGPEANVGLMLSRLRRLVAFEETAFEESVEESGAREEIVDVRA